ncbi:DUF881 domain-containing protein [Kitasatospora sp. NPDC088351]|uniref:DUF881 domain-containing protein n=1 Tax=unclassified Kitasatospora TaxID=2633591 RepID=UPI003412C7FB
MREGSGEGPEKAAGKAPERIPEGPVAGSGSSDQGNGGQAEQEAEGRPAKPEAKAEVEAAAEPAAPAPQPVAVPGPEPAAGTAPEAERVRAAEEPAEPGAEPDADDRGAGRRRLKAALWPPRLSRGQLVVAVLLFSLGLALAIQVRSTNDHHSQLRGARQEDLVRILDELDSRQQRLQQEKAELEQSLAKLENSSNQAKEAQEQTRKKVTELGVLAGTVKATGPGIVLTVDDPQGQVKADMLLDTLQELRAAGAEAIQINDVRVVVNTYFTDVSGGGVQIDGKKVSQPYRFTVVGNPQDLTPALNIPGGVVRTLESHQARATISQQQKVVVDALVDLKTPQYAKPAPK